MPAPTIVFDLDGTLIDTAPDLVQTLNVIFAREGLAPLPFEAGRKFVGGGAKAMIIRALEAERRVFPPARIERMFEEFIAHYRDHLAERSRPFPGLADALDALAERNCRLAVCTNKLEHLSVLLLDRFGLADRFVAICGQDTFGVQKPNPEILRRTVAAARGTLQQVIMIGDSITDIHTARATGVPVIAVEFGYSESPITHFHPDGTISHFSQLPATIAAVFPAF